MGSLTWNVEAWAEEQFGECDLGDLRRTKRMVKFAAQAAAKPNATTPEQTERWADCKAAYRLFDQEDVTFDAVIAPHCAATRDVGEGTFLVINDTTELNFGYNRDLPGVGRVGKTPRGRGFYLHSALVVSADAGGVVGLAAQELYVRPLAKVPRVSSACRKRAATRETDVWGRVIDRVGSPPKNVRLIHVCDRGADSFDVYCHLLEQQAGWVIRAAQLKRMVRDDQGALQSLEQTLDAQEIAGSYELQVGAHRGRPARTACLEIRYAHVAALRPRAASRYVRQRGVTEVPLWVVEVREVGAPQNVDPLHWMLLTSQPVHGFADAWRIIEWYERRPLIEEFHKCLKTGCRVEDRQYHSGDRLAPVIGLLSVLAVRLLQLKMAARTDPDLPAARLLPAAWLAGLRLVLKRRTSFATVRDFFRGLAALGGFLGRRGDGEPGWQTIWRGLETLLICLRGAEAFKHKCG